MTSVSSKPQQKTLRTLRGVVTSTIMDKTAVVAVSDMKSHPKYHKSRRSTISYKVHDPRNEAKVGQEVNFVAMRPLSKGKRWMLLSVVGQKKA